jgi:hypothetical protein
MHTPETSKAKSNQFPPQTSWSLVEVLFLVTKEI